ncbi:MAG: family FAD-dependent oxidoreductase [Chitinophagaceae bacterium]|nr:family FAD-dependent oxidoreductase [Chitinophagaceae bacterium]
MSQRTAIVIGAGIAGLAAARALAARGTQVTVLERTQKAVGASIRNFGMIIPFGQSDGKYYERAILSRQIWKQVCNEAGIWYHEAGSLQLAYSQEEWQVLQEVNEAYRHRNYELLSPDETINKSDAVVREGLKGSLYSKDEIIVDPRVAIGAIPLFLTEKYNVEFLWGKAVTDICYPAVYAGKEQFNADEIYVCSGADFETLYPELYSQLPITRCKLQMLRMAAQPGGWRMGPMLCSGLSLIHYNSFKVAGSLAQLTKKLEAEYPEYLKWGIHVMASQNQAGELTIGDSHEYGLTPDPFDKSFINDLILAYLDKFARFKNNHVIETWNGVYPKLTNGEIDVILKPENGVTVVNGLGGAGMTFSFGLLEQLIGERR